MGMGQIMYILQQIRRECATVIERTKLYRGLDGHEHHDTFSDIDAALNQQKPDLAAAANAVARTVDATAERAVRCASTVEGVAQLVLRDDNAVASADLPDFTAALLYFENIHDGGQSRYFIYPIDDDTAVASGSPHTFVFAAAYATARDAARYASTIKLSVLENANEATVQALANNWLLAYDHVLQTLLLAVGVAQATADSAEAACAASAYAVGYADYARNAARPDYQVAALDAAFDVERDAAMPAIRVAAYAHALAYTVAKGVNVIAQSARESFCKRRR